MAVLHDYCLVPGQCVGDAVLAFTVHCLKGTNKQLKNLDTHTRRNNGIVLSLRHNLFMSVALPLDLRTVHKQETTTECLHRS